MKREEIADLMAFVVVAEERSFTRAAARLSMEIGRASCRERV